MARQGSLCQPILIGARSRLIIATCIIALTSNFTSPTVCAQSTDQRDLNLRMSCSAPEDSFWQLRVAVVENESSRGATLSQIVNRCESIAATGAFHISEDAGALTFTPRQSLLSCEFDFRFRGNAKTELNVQVLRSAEYKPRPKSSVDPAWKTISSQLVSIDQLTAGQSTTYPPQSVAGAQDNAIAWSIARIGEDYIRIQPGSGVPFGQVGGEFSFVARVNAMTALASSRMDLVYRLRQASTGKVIVEKQWPVDVDEEGNTTEITISEPCPNVQGVYEICCQLEKEDENLLRRLRGKGTVVATTWQPLVVTSPPNLDAANAAGNQPWQTVGQIQPASKSDWELNQWLPSSSQVLIRRIDPREPSNLQRSEHDGRAVSVIPPSESYVATLPSQHVGQPHKISIRYPAGKYARLRVEIDTSEEFQNPARMFLVAQEQRPDPSDAWETYTFVHYPSADDEYLRLTNVSSELNAEFDSITVTAGPPRLVVERRQPTESRLATLRLDGFEWVDHLTGDVARGESQSKITAQTATMHRLFVATQRVMDYASAVGLNSLLIQASQGDRAWFDSNTYSAGRKVSPWEGHHLEMLLRLADQHSLPTFVRLDPSMQLTAVEASIVREDTGKWLRRTRNATVYNTLNPGVQNQLQQLCDELQTRLQGHPSFAGLALSCHQTSHLAPISAGQLDQTEVQAFANSLGKSNMTPAQLVAWIQADGQKAMQQWLELRTRQIYQQVSQNLARKTLLLTNHVPIEAPGNDDALLSVIDLRRSSFESLDNEVSANVGRAKPIGDFAAVSIGDQAYDQSRARTFMHSSSIRKLSDVIVQYDPQILLVDDSATTLAISPAISNMIRGFTTIPNTPLNDIAGTDAAAKTVHVRYASQNGKVVLVVNNVAPWASDVRCDLATPVDWSDARIIDPHDSDEASSQWRVEQQSLNATLMPGGMLVLAAPASTTTAPVRLWTSRVSGGALAMTDIKEKVTTVVERIGVLSNPDPYEVLSNGGFEKPSVVGIPGWMHTQHPPKSVRLDPSEAIEGKSSVLLTSDERNTRRAWLVSETIRPPTSGRLAVSLACRGEFAPGETSHRLRVSIEGTRSGQPFRQAAEFDVLRDGQWQPRRVVLEASDIDPANVESVRLTIDSLSAGRVWIDEVHLHDWFPTTSERGELQGEAFLAVQGLQRGNVTPAARLLHNYWAQYLINQKDFREAPPVLQATQEEQEPSGMADRIKSWIPRPLRF